MDATTWNERYSQAEPVWPKSPNKWVVNEMGGHVPGVALDLGCGEGRNSIWLADQGWRVTAVDFALNALDRARERARSESAESGVELHISWVQADLTRYEAAPGRYDLVLLTYVHLLDFERRELLRNCVRALAPGGTLLVVGHDTTNLTDGTGGPQDPAVLFSGQDIEGDLQDHLRSGTLVLERSGRAAREVETEDGPVVAWDALFRAKRRPDVAGGFSFGS